MRLQCVCLLLFSLPERQLRESVGSINPRMCGNIPGCAVKNQA